MSYIKDGIKKWTIFASLILLVSLLSSNSSANQCRQIFRKTSSFIHINTGEWAIARQCHGTCYFEATVAHIEATLSRHYKTPVFISRAHLFSHLTTKRLLDKLGEVNIKDIVDPQSPKEFISSGTIPEVMEIIKKHGVLLLGYRNKSAQFMEVENDILDFHYNQIKILLDLYELGDMTKRELTQRAIEIREQTIESVRTNSILPSELPKAPENLLNISEFKVHTIKDTFDLDSKIREAIDSNHSLSLVFRIGHFDIISPNGFYKVPLLAPNMKPTFEAGNHAVLIVGYSLNRVGEISHITLRNSWGDKSGDQGYIHIPYDIFLKRFQYIEFIELTI